MGTPPFSPFENQDRMLQASEDRQRMDLNAIEQVLSIGDFQQQIDHPIDVQAFVDLAIDRIHQIIQFDAAAIYLVNQQTSDIELNSCVPDNSKHKLERQMTILIEKGYIAWALREPRGIVIYSNDGRCRILLHAIATYSRIRGIFVGLLPLKLKGLNNASFPSLSLILRNAANTLESAEYIKMYQQQNEELHTTVDKKVDELRRRDLQLLNAQKMDAVSALAGGIAHQYNNALFALSGGLDLIRLGTNEDPEIEKYIDRIDGIVKRMSDLTLKLLAYAHGGKYKPQTIGVNELVEQALKQMKQQNADFSEPEVRSPSQMHFVYVDVTQMKLALSAIMTNAAEAIEVDGHISVRWKKLPFDAIPQELNLEETAGYYIAFEIKDDGRGMDDATRQRIFEPFFTTKFHGRGLNMAAVYGIIKNHHGSISVKSQVGKGTSVLIFLPMLSVTLQ